ncbi:MAG: hypothetical protein EAY75_07360 [Bacteroidetes bacterium]|nr:MAG: hypothetical protein EAY75_07360 [Bacteroidota bacterium]
MPKNIFAALVLPTILALLPGCAWIFAQTTPFEKSGGAATTTYAEAIDFYKQLDAASSKVLVKTMGPTDAGYPLHLVLLSADGSFDPLKWHKQNKAVILINNGIHPGEPDGIDASMMLVRDVVAGKLKLPANVCLAIVPVYNIGGSLNRGSYSRVNQNGPTAYGFRGNAQNLDLNRDFTKADSREARSFADIFHWLNPDVLVDNHVSDGADYQHTMTMLTTQPDKLGGSLGPWLRNQFEPALYQGMAKNGWEMCPYVDFASTDFNKGMIGFYDSPRYSSGYAALWQTIAFVPETHMLKPFADRVRSTYTFMRVLMHETSKQSATLLNLRQKLRQQVASSDTLPLQWRLDTTQHQLITFKGYEQATKMSTVTGLPQMVYNKRQPFSKSIPYYNNYKPDRVALAPAYYVVPQGWHKVLALLQLNKVQMRPLKRDTTMAVQVYKVADVKFAARAYEGHVRKTSVRFDTVMQSIRFLKGDVLIPLNQVAKRFLVEMLEPMGDDSYFSWNYFDAILQQKEGYTDYRWEEVAADYLATHPELDAELKRLRAADAAFAANASAQLNWVYKRSPYYEPAHNRYPVYRILR